MRTTITASRYFLIGVLCAVSTPVLRAQTSQERIPKEAEARLRAIYDRGEFRAKRFAANWLPDSSGYTVREPDPETRKSVLVRYDAASGKRTVLESPPGGKSYRSGEGSPDHGVVFAQQGNLYVRDPGSGREIRLTNSAASSSVSYRDCLPLVSQL